MLAEAAEEEDSRRVLMETAEHWEFLADVTELHSSPRLNSLRIEFDHPAPLTVSLEQPQSPVEGRDRLAVIALARRQLDDLELRIARQRALIDRLQDRKSIDMADAILESFLSVQQSVLKHLGMMLRAKADSAPSAAPSER
jgi:hypothetical protein